MKVIVSETDIGLIKEVKAFLNDCELADANYKGLCDCIGRADLLILSAIAAGCMGLALKDNDPATCKLNN